MKVYNVTLKGLTPLLMHADNLDFAERLGVWRSRPENKRKSVAGDDRSPPFTWIGSVYTDGEIVTIPFDNLRGCLMAAGTKVPKTRGRGSFKSEASSSITMPDFHVPLLLDNQTVPFGPIEKLMEDEDLPFSQHAEFAKKMGFKLFVKRAAVGNSKHVRVRPMFTGWGSKFQVTVTDDAISEQVLRDIFAAAGRYVGLCDWRPGEKKSPGPFGQFEAIITAA